MIQFDLKKKHIYNVILDIVLYIIYYYYFFLIL